MSQIDCSACSELQQLTPEFAQNGVTNRVSASLKNNTGFNPSNTRDNCEDLNDANDCLVGRMDGELEQYEMCDWKEYMHKLVPNQYEMIKAMIASDCGQWTNISDLESRLAEMCKQLDSMMTPPAIRYGVYPLNTSFERYIGVIAEKNGAPLLTPVPNSELHPQFHNTQMFGIRYGSMQTVRCQDGACRNFEWIAPAVYQMRISDDAEIDDILFYVDKATAQSVMGISDQLWEAYTISSFTWPNYIVGSTHKNLWLQITVDETRMGTDYMTVVLRGTSYPNEKPGYSTISEAVNPERLYRFACT